MEPFADFVRDIKVMEQWEERMQQQHVRRVWFWDEQ